MNELTWLEKLDKEHILYVYYITENVCFSSIDCMSGVIKKHNPSATFKIKLSLGKKRENNSQKFESARYKALY